MKPKRLVVGISGSSGAILGIRLLQTLHTSSVETHLIISPSARVTIEQETGWKASDVLALADVVHAHRDISAPIASGSFTTDGMVIIPCSIKSLSAIANSYTSDLMARAADVTLKEGRPLLLVVREAPLHAGHIRLMRIAAQAGAILFPPVPAFYTHPQTVDEIVDNIVGRVLRRIGIENELYQRWQGLGVPVEPAEGTVEREEAANSTPYAEFFSLPAMTLATVGADGQPHAASVYFAAGPGHALYFFSDPSSQHSLDAAANPRAAAAIHPLIEGWQEIRGLQLRGRVAAVEFGTEWDAAWKTYLAKFPFAAKLEAELRKNTLYVFYPDWIRTIDNRRGFGFKKEWKPET